MSEDSTSFGNPKAPADRHHPQLRRVVPTRVQPEVLMKKKVNTGEFLPSGRLKQEPTHFDDGTPIPMKYYKKATKTFMPITPIRPLTPTYLPCTLQKSVYLQEPRKLLIILDLNGTLFYRADNTRRSVTPRPFLSEFLDFLFANCRLMVWSSARPKSVEAMLASGFGERINELDRVWSRDHFQLHEVDYHRKVLTLKDLEFVWAALDQERKELTGEELRRKHPMIYDQTNTVLLDDSTDKSQLQPHNCLVLPDFDQQRARAGNDIELLKVRTYLSRLIHQSNVSAYMCERPFNSSSEEYSRKFGHLLGQVGDRYGGQQGMMRITREAPKNNAPRPKRGPPQPIGRPMQMQGKTKMPLKMTRKQRKLRKIRLREELEAAASNPPPDQAVEGQPEVIQPMVVEEQRVADGTLQSQVQPRKRKKSHSAAEAKLPKPSM